MDATGLRTRVRGSRWGWSRSYGFYKGLKLDAVVTPSSLLHEVALTPAHVRESRVLFRGTGLSVLLADRGTIRSNWLRHTPRMGFAFSPGLGVWALGSREP